MLTRQLFLLLITAKTKSPSAKLMALLSALSAAMVLITVVTLNCNMTLLRAFVSVREWSVDYSREQLDVTTLPCTVGAAAGAAKWAATKKFQGGFAEITGTLTLYITDNEASLANRLMESVHLNIQDGAKVKLYLDAVSDGNTPPAPSEDASTFIAGSVQFTDFSTSVNPDDPTQAEVSFSMYDVTHWIGQSI